MYALVLAGGKGERLRPYTDDRPKPMVPVAGKPILEYQIEWLRAGGVTHVVLLCGYLHEVIRDYFGDGSRWGLHIEHVVEDHPLGRGGAFKLGFQRVPKGEETVIGTNGDNIHTQPLREMIAAHKATRAAATIMLVTLRSPYGIAVLDGNRITGFQEKPELPYWLNAGAYVFSGEVEPLLPKEGDLEDSTFPELARRGRLYAFQSRSYWRPIDTVKDLSEAAERAEHVKAAIAAQEGARG